MKTMKEIKAVTATSEYDSLFWDAMRFNVDAEDKMRNAFSDSTGAFFAPASGDADFHEVITRESVIRPLATNLKKHTGASVIWAAYSDDRVAFVPPGAPIPGFDAENDFTRFQICGYKIAGMIKMNSCFACDADFDLKKYIVGRMGKSFARTEDRAFINGSGTDEPFGLLHDTEGAETGVVTTDLSYDDVLELFFAVDPKYRANAVWLMNDRTALALRKLKDDVGNYLWNGNSDTVLGKPVRICNEMPDISTGSKPVLFGDFSFYWIVDRYPICMQPLKEIFTMTDQVGYLGFEMLDARLIRRNAVKALSVS